MTANAIYFVILLTACAGGQHINLLSPVFKSPLPTQQTIIQNPFKLPFVLPPLLPPIQQSPVLNHAPNLSNNQHQSPQTYSQISPFSIQQQPQFPFQFPVQFQPQFSAVTPPPFNTHLPSIPQNNVLSTLLPPQLPQILPLQYPPPPPPPLPITNLQLLQQLQKKHKKPTAPPPFPTLSVHPSNLNISLESNRIPKTLQMIGTKNPDTFHKINDKLRPGGTTWYYKKNLLSKRPFQPQEVQLVLPSPTPIIPSQPSQTTPALNQPANIPTSAISHWSVINNQLNQQMNQHGTLRSLNTPSIFQPNSSFNGSSNWNFGQVFSLPNPNTFLSSNPNPTPVNALPAFQTVNSSPPPSNPFNNVQNFQLHSINPNDHKQFPPPSPTPFNGLDQNRFVTGEKQLSPQHVFIHPGQQSHLQPTQQRNPVLPIEVLNKPDFLIIPVTIPSPEAPHLETVRNQVNFLKAKHKQFFDPPPPQQPDDPFLKPVQTPKPIYGPPKQTPKNPFDVKSPPLRKPFEQNKLIPPQWNPTKQQFEQPFMPAPVKTHEQYKPPKQSLPVQNDFIGFPPAKGSIKNELNFISTWESAIGIVQKNDHGNAEKGATIISQGDTDDFRKVDKGKSQNMEGSKKVEVVSEDKNQWRPTEKKPITGAGPKKTYTKQQWPKGGREAEANVQAERFNEGEGYNNETTTNVQGEDSGETRHRRKRDIAAVSESVTEAVVVSPENANTAAPVEAREESKPKESTENVVGGPTEPVIEVTEQPHSEQKLEDLPDSEALVSDDPNEDFIIVDSSEYDFPHAEAFMLADSAEGELLSGEELDEPHAEALVYDDYDDADFDEENYEPVIESRSFIFEESNGTTLRPTAMPAISEQVDNQTLIPQAEALVDPRKLRSVDLMLFLDEAIRNSSQYLPDEAESRSIEIVDPPKKAIKTPYDDRSKSEARSFDIIEPPKNVVKPGRSFDIVDLPKNVVKFPYDDNSGSEARSFDIVDPPKNVVKPGRTFDIFDPPKNVVKFPNDDNIGSEARNIDIVDPPKDVIKFPYYERTEPPINVDSALRFAENLTTFSKGLYESKEDNPCDEVDVELSEHPEEPGPDGSQPVRRLKKLGNKIDCLKNKNFGKEPLDNPLFKEEFVSVGRSAPDGLAAASQQPDPSVAVFSDVIRLIKQHLNEEERTQTRHFDDVVSPRQLNLDRPEPKVHSPNNAVLEQLRLGQRRPLVPIKSVPKVEEAKTEQPPVNTTETHGLRIVFPKRLNITKMYDVAKKTSPVKSKLADLEGYKAKLNHTRHTDHEKYKATLARKLNFDKLDKTKIPKSQRRDSDSRYTYDSAAADSSSRYSIFDITSFYPRFKARSDDDYDENNLKEKGFASKLDKLEREADDLIESVRDSRSNAERRIVNSGRASEEKSGKHRPYGTSYYPSYRQYRLLSAQSRKDDQKKTPTVDELVEFYSHRRRSDDYKPTVSTTPALTVPAANTNLNIFDVNSFYPRYTARGNEDLFSEQASIKRKDTKITLEDLELLQSAKETSNSILASVKHITPPPAARGEIADFLRGTIPQPTSSTPPIPANHNEAHHTLKKSEPHSPDLPATDITTLKLDPAAVAASNQRKIIHPVKIIPRKYLKVVPKSYRRVPLKYRKKIPANYHN